MNSFDSKQESKIHSYNVAEHKIHLKKAKIYCTVTVILVFLKLSSSFKSLFLCQTPPKVLETTVTLKAREPGMTKVLLRVLRSI